MSYKINEKNVMNKNKLIRRRRIFFLRRVVFISVIFLIFLLVLVNSSIFNIRYLKITGNRILSEEYIMQELNEIFNKNILFYSIDRELTYLRENKYIKDIKYKKQYPNTLNVILQETEVDYYIYFNNKYYIFDREAILVDILDYKQNFQLIEMIGVRLPSDIKIGQALFLEDSRESKWIKNLSDLMDLNNSNINFNYIDLTDVHNVILGYNNLQIKVGSNSDLRQKLNIVINTLNSNSKFKDSNGYIDVRSKNYPVVSLE